MSRSFVRASSQYLRNLSAPVTVAPLTMCCWARTADVTNNKALMSIGDSTVNNRFTLAVTPAERVTAATQGGGSTSTATSTGAAGLIAANQWFHAAGVYNAGSRIVYTTLQGSVTTNKVTASATRTPAGVDRVVVGSLHTLANYWDGQIAEAAIWDVALTDSEIAQMGQLAVSPLMIRPENLICYWPLQGYHSPEHNRLGGFDLTVTGPTQGEHVRIHYPRSPLLFPSIDLPTSGAVDQTLPSVQQTAATIEYLRATVTQTAPKVTQAAAAKETFSGAVAQALPRLGQSAQASSYIAPAVAQVLPKVQQTAVVDTYIAPSVAQALPPVAQAAVATERATAGVAQVLPKTAQSVVAVERIAIAAAQILPKATQAIAGSEFLKGAVAQVLPKVVQAADTEHNEPGFEGVTAQTLPRVVQVVAMLERIPVVAAQILPKVHQFAQSEIIYEGVAGSANQVLPFISQSIEALIEELVAANGDWVTRLRRRRRRI